MTSRLFSRLASLAECLCAQIEESDVPGVCFCGVLPGDAAAHYSGNCLDGNGMAWVRLISAYPADAPGRANETVGNCGGSIGASVELGIMRDFVIEDRRGNPPSPELLLAATDLQIEDSMVMMRAINCCGDASSSSKDWLLGAYTPVGPLGALVGGTWTLSLVI